MRDGAQKEVADSTDSAAYFGPMSEAKQNHEALVRLTDTWQRDRVIAIGSRRLNKKGAICPHYFAALTVGEVWDWLPELWAAALIAIACGCVQCLGGFLGGPLLGFGHCEQCARSFQLPQISPDKAQQRRTRKRKMSVHHDEFSPVGPKPAWPKVCNLSHENDRFGQENEQRSAEWRVAGRAITRCGRSARSDAGDYLSWLSRLAS